MANVCFACDSEGTVSLEVAEYQSGICIGRWCKKCGSFEPTSQCYSTEKEAIDALRLIKNPPAEDRVHPIFKDILRQHGFSK